MAFGYHGKILRVNLSDGTLRIDEQDEGWYRSYLGGAAMSAYYLMKEQAPGVDPLGPDNRLIVAPGVLTGAPFSGSGRLSVGARSPLTGGLGKSEVGGFAGAELKHAGFDGIVFEGRAEKPVYLWIKDGSAELRDAGRLWGRQVLETDEAIRAETGERFARIACIGPAGERAVRFACLVSDLRHSAGRTGMGAVMGSKNLKAIVVRGKTPPRYADPEGLKALARAMAEAVPTRARAFHEYGTGAAMEAFNATGNLPTRNFRDGWFENVGPTTAIALKDTIRVGMESCYACAVRCKKLVKVESPWVVDPRYGGPEYETLGVFGSNCGIDDLKAIARAHHLCQAYGMDTLTAGNTIAFAMECFEQGYLSKADLDGLEPTWGNARAMLELLESMGERRGIGDLLAEGSRLAAERIGGGARDLSIQVKGLELGMHEPRLKAGLGLGYSVANHGADHMLGLHDTSYEKPGPGLTGELVPLGILEPMPAAELSARKAAAFAGRHRWQLVLDSACLCNFVPWNYGEVMRLVKATTGWEATLEELLLVGERAITLGRAFNAREGFTPADDQLPRRFFSPPTRGALADKGQALDPAGMEEARQTYYGLMGWDPATGAPTRPALERLGLGWVAG